MKGRFGPRADIKRAGPHLVKGGGGGFPPQDEDAKPP